jgi:F420-non-reducing hydrogenase large subunit
MKRIAGDPNLGPVSDIRNMDLHLKQEGVGCVEAARGTLIHHYQTDERGLLAKVNLIVATQQNAAPICLSVKKAAQSFINNGEVKEGLLNMVEMAFRAYDPVCCAPMPFAAITSGLNIRSSQESSPTIKELIGRLPSLC